MTPLLLGLSLLLGLLALGFFGLPLIAWTAFFAGWLFLAGAHWFFWLIFLPIALLFNLGPLRRTFVTRPLMGFLERAGLLPKISATEREALEAGTVWFEGELFSGHPDFERLFTEKSPLLTEAEQAFIDGPVEEICRMSNDWQIHQERDLPAAVWTYLREKGFFGMIVPKQFGGLQFSAYAVSEVIGKLSSRSLPLGITVMVPNSLGPAELLVHYGTDAQKAELLPRLARGELLPCFALTEPHAGSDAGSMRATGTVFRADDGALKLRLEWSKRYITLSGRANLIGLAFQLKDPDNLLGKGAEPGITCALIPESAPGIVRGRRHDPLGVPFINCPIEGHDVVVGVDAIIGGPARAGQGWRMLMEQLAAGRGIMLPAQSTVGVKMAARVAGAYAGVRKQFGVAIGRFEGVQEPLARIGGSAYLLEAARRFTCGALDGGAKPAVVSAIAKYHFTEIMRARISDAMDVLGGAAISRGPRNPIAHAYMAAPISITVEGANILTRTLMIFGQGAIRCHPWAQKEIAALEAKDLSAFDDAFWSHVGHVASNVSRSVVLSLSRGYAARVPGSPAVRRDLQKLAWASASFAAAADMAMALHGAALKRKESMAGRFSDVFSWMYLASSVVKRFEEEGRRREDRPFYRWAMDHAFARMQEGFDAIYRDFGHPGVDWLLRGPVGVWSRMNPLSAGPRDADGQAIAEALQTPGDHRDRLTSGAFRPRGASEPLARLEEALKLCQRAEELAQSLRRAVKQGRLPKLPFDQLVAKAIEETVLTRDEAEILAQAERARDEAIQVDSFTDAEYFATALRDA
jgi:acyl-CoA dehydrogenase